MCYAFSCFVLINVFYFLIFFIRFPLKFKGSMMKFYSTFPGLSIHLVTGSRCLSFSCLCDWCTNIYIYIYIYIYIQYIHPEMLFNYFHIFCRRLRWLILQQHKSCVILGFFFKWHITVHRLFNSKAIFEEGESWYYLTHSWVD